MVLFNSNNNKSLPIEQKLNPEQIKTSTLLHRCQQLTVMKKSWKSRPEDQPIKRDFKC